MAAVAPRGAPMSFADLAAKLQPAVVNISTTQKVQLNHQQNPFAGSPFEDFFKRFGGQQQGGNDDNSPPQTREAVSLGSGFIVSADGYIVTNNHVVAPARNNAVVESITVTLSDRTQYTARLVGRDEAADLAVLKIDPRSPLPFVRFALNNDALVGDWVVAIGSPYALNGSVTAGIISALHRNLQGGGVYDRFIQTDASINSGNSGGPLFDLNGNVVGINTALYSPTGGNIGIGFAIPSEQAAPVVEALRRGERVRRGYIGVALQSLSENGIGEALGLDPNRGELLRSVTPGGPAARAGLQDGDVILSVAGQPVTPDQTLAFLVAQQAIGSSVPMELVRNGQRRTVNVTIAERPTEQELARLNGIDTPDDQNGGRGTDGGKPVSDTSARASLGVSLQTLTPELAARAGIRAPFSGVIITDIDQNSDAAQKLVQVGDVILRVDNVPTNTPAAITQAVAAARQARRGSVLLQIRRGNGPPGYVGVELPPAQPAR
jgi:serine protease Do